MNKTEILRSRMQRKHKLNPVEIGAVFMVNPNPADYDEFGRYLATDPETHLPSNVFGAILADPQLAERLNVVKADTKVQEYFAGLDPVAQMEFMPSRYCQGYADLDIYAQYLREELSNITSTPY